MRARTHTYKQRAWAEFSKLKEAEALGCLTEFMASDMTRIRNKAACVLLPIPPHSPPFICCHCLGVGNKAACVFHPLNPEH